MDTIETQAPVGSDDVTSSPDTATVDTQTPTPAQSVDGASADQAGGNASESLLAGKYKTPEELANAYTNLESKLGELGPKAALADELQEKYGVTPDQLRAQMQALEIQQRQERYANDPLAPLVDEVQSLKQTIQQQQAEKAEIQLKSEVDSFLKGNPEYEAHKEQILKLAQTPGIGYDKATGQDLGSIGDIAQEYFGTARAQGQQDAYNKIEVKKNTQATGVASTPQKEFGLEDFSTMSASEMKAVLLARQS